MRWAAVVALVLSLPLFAADVVGFVYTPDGMPVDGAAVTAFDVASHAVLATTRSDAGEFAFSGLPDAVTGIEVRAEGFPATSALAIPGRIPLSLIAGTPRGYEEGNAKTTGDRSIDGTVRVAGKPLAGLPVLVQSLDDGVSVRAVTDARGHYFANALAPGRYMVSITPELGLRSPHEGEMAAEGASPPNGADLKKARSATVDLDLTAPPMLFGRVVDAEGKPVAGAQVQVVLAGRSTLDFAYDACVYTRKDGRYAIAAPPFDAAETAVVAVAWRGHAIARSKPFTVGTTDREVDVALPHFESVTVRVADRAGKPIPKARVAFASAEEAATLRDPARLLLAPFASRTVRTDDAGEVVLQLTTGAWDFVIGADQFLVATIAERTIRQPATIAVVLEPAFTIHGRVHREDLGVANVRVTLLGERVLRDRPSIATDANGAFEIADLARGKYRISLAKHEELLQRVVEAEAPSTVDVKLPPAGLLRINVIDAVTREPVRDLVYSIEPTEITEESARDGATTVERSDNTSNGRVQLTLSRGTYRVSASAAGYTSHTPLEVRVTEREPAEVTIALGRGITLSGRVTDEGGTPIAGAAVLVESNDDPMQPGTTEPGAISRARVGLNNEESADDGSFTITGLESPHVAVTVRKTGFVPLRKLIDVDETAPLDLQLLRGLMLEGIVRRGGKPVPGAQVEGLTSALGGSQQMAVTDASGRFVMRGLIAARYTVSAFFEDLHALVDNVDPRDESELVVSLDAKPAGIVFGTVTGIPATAGSKLVRRVVYVQGDDRGGEGLIDEAGNYRIEDAPTGTVYVTAQLESLTTARSSFRKRVDLAAGQALRVDLDVAGTVAVRGRVTNDGKPVAGVRVVFANAEGLTGSASSRADGTYEIGLPAEGMYQVYAHSELLATGNVQLVHEVRSGDTVDIELREQAIEGTVVDAITHAPLQGVLVTLTLEGSMASYAGETFTNADGRFRILTASTGAYRLIAWGRGYAQRAVPLQLGNRAQQVAFELTKTEELRVQIVDANSGAPLTADLVLQTADGMYLPIRPEQSSDQTAFVYSLAAGKYRLTVAVPGYPERKVEVTAPGVVRVAME